jgi:hypothetical protein
MDPKLEKLARLVGEAMARRWMQIMRTKQSGRGRAEGKRAAKHARNRKQRRGRRDEP